jgi:hypothetical protein
MGLLSADIVSLRAFLGYKSLYYRQCRVDIFLRRDGVIDYQVPHEAKLA